ncbi:energy-coupling factor ABC transporter ATP-binding protein [Halocatena halophila]|uniref:energy-coupling factor ABC transporter ATP-binding protein n=1 Tax=Halocatena halophila TaxID=2814576 RepID=UPI002ED5A037
MSLDEVPLVNLQCEAHTYPDGTVGIHDIEFSVYPDEVIALVGGNGAGKSTLLEHLNATLVPGDGELVIDGTQITENNISYAIEEVGIVFQDADMQLVAPTVLDDVMFGLQNYGIPDDESKQRAREALAIVDAGHLEDQIPHYLSGGEKRLVGLAGVLVLDPSVVVLDEPLAGLDPERSQLVTDRIRQIHERGISVVFSTHDLDFAATVADRVCVMADGTVVECGTPREVFYDDPLLAKANLHPPSAVRVARDAGLGAQPVTEAHLVAHFTDASNSETEQTLPPDGSEYD